MVNPNRLSGGGKLVRFKKVILVAILILPLLYPQSSLASDAAVIFLKIPVGARSTGMGEAFTAVADDASATWWNPAALAFLHRSEASYMYSNDTPLIIGDMYFHYVGLFHHFERFGTLGGNIVLLKYSEFLTVINPFGVFPGYKKPYELSASLCFGLSISKYLSCGLSTKYIYSELGYSEKYSAFAFDLSAFYQRKLTDVFTLRIGANLMNMGPKVREVRYEDISYSFPLPTNIRIGVAGTFYYHDLIKITASYEIEKELVTRNSDGSIDPFYQSIFTTWTDDGGFFSAEERREFITHFGLEAWILDIFALRGGLWNDEVLNIYGTTIGFSLKYLIAQLDFSMCWRDRNVPPFAEENESKWRLQLSVFYDHITQFDPTPWD